MAAITSVQSGNWSAASTWDGGVVPGDGDFANVGHAVVIDQNIGSVVGGGIKRIHLYGDTAALSLDNTAQRTILFGSTGLDPVGSGTSTKPGADATMHGFFVARGNLNLVATADNPVIVDSADGTSPWYIHHAWGDVNFAGTAKYDPAGFNIQYFDFRNLGADVGGFKGINWALHTLPATIQNGKCKDPFALFTATPPQGTITQFTAKKILIDGALSEYCMYFPNVTGVKNPVIEDITEINSRANGSVVYFIGRPAKPTIKRIVSIQNGASGFARTGVVISGNGTNTLGDAVIENIYTHMIDDVVEKSCVTISANTKGALEEYPIISKCIGYHNDHAVVTNGSGDESGCIFRESIAWAHTASAYGHSTYITYGGKPQLWQKNITVLESGAQYFGLFVYNGAHVNVDGHTVVNIGSQSLETGLSFGNGYDPTNECTGTIKNSIAYNCNTGIKAFPGPATGTNPVTFTEEYAGSGVHHNAVYGASNAYSRSTGEPWDSSNFDDGVDLHPNAKYGDISTNPGFVDTSRNPYAYAAHLGATGTDLEKLGWLKAEFAKIHGLNGAAPAPGVTVEDMRQWLFDGFAPTNQDYANGYDGAWIGAVEPVNADSTAPTISSLSATSTGATTATLTVTTDEGNGSIFFLLDENATATEAAILAGLSQSVTATGEQTINASALDAATAYYAHVLHRDAANNVSNILHSSAFKTSDLSITLDFPDTAPCSLLGYQVWSKLTVTDEEIAALWSE